MSTYTTDAEFEDAYETIQRTFRSGKTKSLAWRKWQLKQIWWMIEDNEAEMVKALNTDLNRHEFETHFVEFMSMKNDVLDHLKHLEEWAADEIPDAGLIMGRLSGAHIRKEPLGVALIIGPWNFPITLTIQPLIAAVTAGCAVMLKPSEMAEASQNLMIKMIAKYLDQDAIRIVTGGARETGKILEHKFDEVFFTGSSKVARFITAATAKHLTPTVLELGGQGPAIVCESADLDLAARKIAWVKYLNAGQICLSVNHVFVHPNVHDQFIAKLEYWFEEFLKSGKEDMTTIINARNFDRLKGMMDRTRGKIVRGGTSNRDTLHISPTVITDVTMKDPLLEEELFGPILPVIKDNFRKAYQAINTLGHPLGIYIFSKNKAEIDEIISHTQSGGVTINEVMLHAGVPTAPFGGVGESGTGYYHGKHGFDAFTHTRTVVSPPGFLAKLLGFLQPPYDIKNIGKVKVANKGAFKRGETMEDQKVGKGRFAFIATLLKLSAIAGVLAAVDQRTGEHFGLTKALLSVFESAKARIGSS
ncbi:aldehyde dehydrogenase [Mytilinidion resinicola]|uniref:Aldehyde dehydrogenase n=1 Tax=Mytilinidion resinicola TaxID=574789 RepID=A0A6A6Y491_9PEZI|nr:aldehyde dehydrogenase [Mytilinidion resinicola]KAF2802844.1 aldehyde dehydrogenase [Mytilinidion resinicola]